MPTDNELLAIIADETRQLKKEVKQWRRENREYLLAGGGMVRHDTGD